MSIVAFHRKLTARTVWSTDFFNELEPVGQDLVGNREDVGRL